MSNLYNKKGERISDDEYMKLSRDKDYKIIKQENVGDYWISTVWLGRDHRFTLEGRPLIFETMVFGKTKDGYVDHGDEHDVERYSDEKSAKEGHDFYVRKYQNL
jgi:hypothetical protein